MQSCSHAQAAAAGGHMNARLVLVYGGDCPLSSAHTGHHSVVVTTRRPQHGQHWSYVSNVSSRQRHSGSWALQSILQLAVQPMARILYIFQIVCVSSCWYPLK